MRPQVQGVAHLILTGSDVHNTAAELGDVVDRGLQDAVVAAAQIALAYAHGDAREVLHPGVHYAWKLLLVLARDKGWFLRATQAKQQGAKGHENEVSLHKSSFQEQCLHDANRRSAWGPA